MKLTSFSLFLIIIVSLFLGMVTGRVVEGMTSNKDKEDKENKQDSDTQSGNGIPKSQIPEGDEDLYILKSQVIPPVCPACPEPSACPRQKPCPACPPCGRCPEPAFECKKVPNYRSSNEQYLPKPMLTDFSSF
jgi:hypothetical protein